MKITYKGAVYVESERKRCEDGTHWNDKLKKCAKLSPQLEKRIAKAKAHSAEARKASHYTKREYIMLSRREAHGLASEAHGKAASSHSRAADLAEKEGFLKLKEHHRSREASHNYASFKHRV